MGHGPPYEFAKRRRVGSSPPRDHPSAHRTAVRLSHDDAEWDMGFRSVKWMKALGLVKATPKGMTLPADCPLPALDF